MSGAASPYRSAICRVLLSFEMFGHHVGRLKLCEQISFRRWRMELAEGWLIESWTKCLGCIALDGHFVLFSDDGKVLKVINAKASTVSKREDTTVFLSENVKGIFSDSQH